MSQKKMECGWHQRSVSIFGKMKTLILRRNINKIPILEVVHEDLRKEKLPIIVLYHGWKSSKELILTQARKLADKNFRIVVPDALNHGQRKQDISSIPSFTFFNSIQGNIAEFDTLINFYRKIKLLDESRIGVGGYSMGGMTTSALMTQHPEIKVGASIMGSPKPVLYSQRVQKRANEVGFPYPKDLPLILSWLNNYDLSMQPEKIAQRPFLMWHGTKDQRIPFVDPSDFYQDIKDKNYAQNTKFWVGKNEGHLVTTELMDDIADFFADNL